jgi:hypothetical protein
MICRVFDVKQLDLLFVINTLRLLPTSQTRLSLSKFGTRALKTVEVNQNLGTVNSKVSSLSHTYSLGHRNSPTTCQRSHSTNHG